MQKETKFIAIGQHRSEYPDPITFVKGTPLVIGDKYEGSEDWDNWHFCTIASHTGGWVPAQLIEWGDDIHHGISKADYTAKELDVNEGDILIATKALNGWVWCNRVSDNQSGWVPTNILLKLKS